MIYIMVTHFDYHWDRIRDNRTKYSVNMLRGKMRNQIPVSGTKTVFIKINNDSKQIENCWRGKTYDFKKDKVGDKDIIRFRVEIEEAIQCPSKYTSYSQGWYVDEGVDKTVLEGNPCDPSFFNVLTKTTDWQEFEKYTYFLIRAIGIHTSHRFGPRKQKGKADGFFKFANLAVLYDCTLDRDFEKNKEMQINNFCDQLQKGKIEYNSKSISIKPCTKNVWIITRISRARILKEIDEVIVKEIPISKLIELYRERLEKDIDEKGLEIKLQNI